MDPNQAWKDLSDAYQEKDIDRAKEIARDLLHWIRSDGFAPTITRHQEFDIEVVRLTCLGIISL